MLRFLWILLYPQNFNHKNFKHSTEGNSSGEMAYLVVILENISAKSFYYPIHEISPSKLIRYTITIYSK